ncbi:MAG: SIR2-like domain [Thermoleophilaceae bacterium]|nr:SIR2-like domain [Thermoleophilaceae bacterium]
MSQTKLLLVTGAGASTSLSSDPERPLPLMLHWAQRMRERIGTNLSEMTGLDRAADGVEFEERLGALFRWLQGLDVNHRFSQMVRPNESPDPSWPQQFEQALSHARRHGDRFMARLHESLFEEFGPDRIDADASVRAYRELFERLGLGSPFPQSLICATTNYDRSLEMALDALGLTPRTGFISHLFRTPELHPEGLGEFTEEPALLYLHGAVGWYRTESGRIHAMPADQGFNDTLGRPAVLYPSPNKDPQLSETAGLWTEFGHAVQRASHILVLGHALNDGHLVNELRSTKAPVAVSYLPMQRTTEAAAEDAEAQEARIKKLLPGATPIALEFGPDLNLDTSAVIRWRGAT